MPLSKKDIARSLQDAVTRKCLNVPARLTYERCFGGDPHSSILTQSMSLVSEGRLDPPCALFDEWRRRHEGGGGAPPLVACIVWFGKVLDIMQADAWKYSDFSQKPAIVFCMQLFLRECHALVSQDALLDNPTTESEVLVNMQARIWLLIGREYALAELCFLYLLHIRPNEGHHADMLGLCAYHLGDYARAIRLAATPSQALRSHEQFDPSSSAALAAREWARKAFAAESKRAAVTSWSDIVARRNGIVLARLAGEPSWFCGLNPLVYDSKAIYSGSRGLAYLSPKPDGVVTRHMQAAVVVLCTNPCNYYHMIIEFLGKLFGLFGGESAAGDAPELPGPICVTSSPLQSVTEEAAAMVLPQSLASRLTFVQRDDVVQCGTLYVVDIQSPEFLDPPTSSLWDTMTCPRHVLPELRSAFLSSAGVTQTTTPSLAIYVSRLSGDRNVNNEDMLFRSLQAWGQRRVPHLQWTVLDKEEQGKGIGSQARLFASASLVVGPHGAGLVNVIFAPPGCKVLEFPTHGHAIRLFKWLCREVGHEHSFVDEVTALYNGSYTMEGREIECVLAAVDKLWGAT